MSQPRTDIQLAVPSTDRQSQTGTADTVFITDSLNRHWLLQFKFAALVEQSSAIGVLDVAIRSISADCVAERAAVHQCTLRAVYASTGVKG